MSKLVTRPLNQNRPFVESIGKFFIIKKNVTLWTWNNNNEALYESIGVIFVPGNILLLVESGLDLRAKGVITHKFLFDGVIYSLDLSKKTIFDFHEHLEQLP